MHEESRVEDSEMKIEDVKAIDVHAHIGQRNCYEHPILNEFESATPAFVTELAGRANTLITFVSPFEGFDIGGDVLSANLTTSKIVSKMKSLKQWVVVTPFEKETFSQAAKLLKNKDCVGIKLHPKRSYSLQEYGYRIFEFASLFKTVILSHSGDESCKPEDLAKLANKFPDVNVIAAHLGYGWDGSPYHHIRAVEMNRHGNLFIDTSSRRSIRSRMLEWAVSEIGSERILYGTDSPSHFTPMQRARVDCAFLSSSDKKRILYKNAAELFGVKDG